MKKIISIVSIAAALIFIAIGLSSARPVIHYDHILTGQNDPIVDIPAVQDAVNQGGKILLQGTFNFGVTQVIIQNMADGTQNEVEIYGVTDKKKTPLTKIMGGFWAFYSPLPVIPGSTPPSLPNSLSPGPKIIIKGIHFEGALWAPIHIAYSSGATISGNKITNVIPYGAAGFDLNAGILCGTFFAQTGIFPGTIYREGAVIGLLRISNN